MSSIYNDVNKYVYKHQTHIDKDHPLIPVKSAFGGIGLYKTQSIINCYYIGFKKYGDEYWFLCEHVPFNEGIKGKLFINPKFIITDSQEEHINNNIIFDNESVCNFVGSRGIAKSCYLHNINLISSTYNIDNFILDYTFDGMTLYVCNASINNFARNFLPKLKHKIILVSGDSDDTMTYEICHHIINSDKIIHWFVQNCVFDHEKITRIPVGLDYHTIANNGKPEWGTIRSPLNQEMDIMSLDKPMFYDRYIKCYSTFHFELGRGDRLQAYRLIPRDIIDYESMVISRIESHKKQTKYAFVVSPFGVGLDCHRTWEALVLGCIPIIKHSGLDPLFDDLPVLIINEWSDLNQELLKNTIEKFKNKKFNMEKITLKYWVDKINSKNDFF